MAGAKAAEKRRQPHAREAEIDADPHLTLHLAGRVDQRVDGALQRRVMLAQMIVQEAPAARQHEALADAVEELYPQRALQPRDTLTDRRRRAAELRRRAADAAVLGDGAEDVQLVEVEIVQFH